MAEGSESRHGELAASEALRVALLQSALDCVVVMNDEGRVVEWNQAAAETFGYRREVAVGALLADLIVPERLRGQHEAGLERYLSTGRSEILGQRIEVPGMCADGSEIDVELTVTPVRLRRTLFVGTLRDITEAKQAAAALRQAKDDAEASDRAKSMFLASMSHELRTPLTSILGFSDLLAREHAAQPARREAWLQHIRGSGEHLLALINDVLDLSKIEAGQLHVDRSPVHVFEFFAELEQLVRPLAEEKGLEFEVGYVDPIPEHVLTDPLRLRQVVFNLLGNAVKFTERGFVRVEVSALPREKELLLQLAVSDSGPGIAPDDHQRIFSAFTQTREGRVLGGTGLGLDISRRLARALGGDLTLESELGAGSRFTATVLAGALGTTTLVNTASYDMRRFQAKAKQSEGLRGRRILLVDDHPPNRDLVSYLLEQRGAQVVQAVDGEDCLNHVRTHGDAGFDLVLMDMQMPGVDGYEATRRLRLQGFRRPVVALTAHSLSEDRERCLAAGCDAYLSKPIDEAALMATLTEQLRRIPLRRFLQTRAAAPSAEPAAAVPAALEPLHSTKADEERFRPLLERFVASLSSKALPALRSALESEVAKVLGSESHKLVGSGAGYGFPQITDFARRVEDAVNSQAPWDEIAKHSRALIALLERARV